MVVEIRYWHHQDLQSCLHCLQKTTTSSNRGQTNRAWKDMDKRETAFGVRVRNSMKLPSAESQLSILYKSGTLHVHQVQLLLHVAIK